MKYTYTYDIWGGVASCTPVEEPKEEKPKKPSKKKEVTAQDNEEQE